MPRNRIVHPAAAASISAAPTIATPFKPLVNATLAADEFRFCVETVLDGIAARIAARKGPRTRR
ncbi:MAG: hypothetical protein ACR2JQ_01160 [Mycobacteriales bacterium]